MLLFCSQSPLPDACTALFSPPVERSTGFFVGHKKAQPCETALLVEDPASFFFFRPIHYRVRDRFECAALEGYALPERI